MRLLKFYGRTMEGTLFQIKRELGEEALIVETKTIDPRSATARLHPGARYEISAAVETASGSASKIKTFGEHVKKTVGRGGSIDKDRVGKTVMPSPARPKPAEAAPSPVAVADPAAEPSAAPRPVADARPSAVLSDMGELKAQMRDLADQGDSSVDIRRHAEFQDYRFLIDQGVDPTILAHSFRRWLDWRMGLDGAEGGYPPLFTPGEVMRGHGFREWLWNEWRHQLTFQGDLKLRSGLAPKTEIVGIVGGSGVGKSTTLAKLASKSRQAGRKKVAVLSIDTARIGANEQWKRYSQLMDITFMQAVSQEDIGNCIKFFDRFDWIGIDTPGGMERGSDAGKLYGRVLARCPQMDTTLVIDTSNRDRANREMMNRMRPFKPSQLIFSKVDEAPEKGSMVNLTLEEPWMFEMASTGRRIPEDLEPVTPDRLWHWVFENGASDEAETATVTGGVA